MGGGGGGLCVCVCVCVCDSVITKNITRLVVKHTFRYLDVFISKLFRHCLDRFPNGHALLPGCLLILHAFRTHVCSLL